MKFLTKTNERLLNISVVLLRVTIGTILFGAGAGKVFSWFGGFGLQMTLHYFAEMGFSAPLAYLSTFTELIGGFLLILGLLTRPAAFAVMINMIVATVVTLPKGFLIGMAAYPFTLAIIALVILLTGPMAYSIDALLNRKEWSSNFFPKIKVENSIKTLSHYDPEMGRNCSTMTLAEHFLLSELFGKLSVKR